MEEAENTRNRRSQRDYNLGFKLAVVDQVEKGEMTYKQAQNAYGIQGRSTVLTWLRKHGTLDWSKPALLMKRSSKETPAQKIKRLEKQLEDEKLKNSMLNYMIDLADRELGTSNQKKALVRTVRYYQEAQQMSLSHCCRLFGMSRQAIYQAEHRYRRREQELAPVRNMVMDVRMDMPRLGTRKVYHIIKADLESREIKMGRDALFSYLRRENMLIRPKKNYTRTTYSKHWMRKYPNLLQHTDVTRTEQVLVSDITYIKSRERTHYLSLVTDAYSRRIMGHHLSDDMSSENVAKAMKMAIGKRTTALPMIHHSDRGLQYCSEHYQKLLRENNITPSMTDGYDCYQNALAERMNGILKQEFLIHRCNTGKELKKLIEQSIDTYNEKRPHLSLKMQTPNFIHQRTLPDIGQG
ncbi:MAG: IS3 family transposase, partial [Bacteroidetes bacterium]